MTKLVTIFFILLLSIMLVWGCGLKKVDTEKVTLKVKQPKEESTIVELKDPETLNITNVEIDQLEISTSDMLEIYKSNTEIYETVKEVGAKVVNIPEYGTFFIFWLPPEWKSLNKKRIMVLMHGKESSAYARLYDLYETAKKEKIGLVSIQWGWPLQKGEDFHYLDKTENGIKVSYELMTIAIEFIDKKFGANKKLSAWNGFSQSSSSSITYAYLDKNNRNNYFRIFISISGAIDPEKPFIKDLIDGKYGKKPLQGKHFYLWAGSVGNKDQEKIDKVILSKDIIKKQGGIVDKLIITEGGTRITWNSSKPLQGEAIKLWKNLSGD